MQLDFLHSVFAQGNDAGEQRTSSQLLLSKHMALHKKLRPYTELMHWCKVMDRKAYTGLTNVYTQGLGKIYERDIKQFLEEAKQQITGVVGMSSTIII